MVKQGHHNILKKVMEEIWRGKNLDLYLTVFMAGVVAILNIIGLTNSSILASVTLATLALLASGLLVNRHQMETLMNGQDSENAIVFLKKWPDLNQEFLMAREIYLVGINLVRTTINNYVLFESKLNQGCNLRVLLMDPEGGSINIVYSRTYEPNTSEEAKVSILNTINTWMKLSRAVNSPNNLELRTLDYVLPYGIILIDPDLPSGKIFVETYPYKMSSRDVPKFQLISAQSPYWYAHYRSQFDVLWKYAKPWQEAVTSSNEN